MNNLFLNVVHLTDCCRTTMILMSGVQDAVGCSFVQLKEQTSRLKHGNSNLLIVHICNTMKEM